MPRPNDQPRRFVKTLGYQVTVEGKLALDELHRELRRRGCQAYFGHILDVLIKSANVDALEKELPRNPTYDEGPETLRQRNLDSP
jgi:hypothetical protein